MGNYKVLPMVLVINHVYLISNRKITWEFLEMLEVLFEYKRICGIWPEGNEIKYFGKITINLLSITYSLIGFSLYTLRVCSEPTATASNIADALFTLQCTFNYSFNYIGCAILYKSSSKFFENVTNFKEFGNPKSLRRTNRRLNRDVRVMVSYCTFASVTIHLYSLATYNLCTAKRNALNSISYCGYCCGIYFPYNYDEGLSFIFHVFINTYNFTMLCFCGGIFICAAYCGIEFIAARIDHLVEMLDEVLAIENCKERIRRLKVCVRYHINIISLVDELNLCYSAINTPALFFYSVTLGLCLFALLKDYSYKAATIIIGYICGTFIMSASGQKLDDKSSSICQAAYNIKWYEADPKLRRYVLLIMLRAQKPLTYNAGPFGSFSLPVFMFVVRGAYTYMTMQSNMK